MTLKQELKRHSVELSQARRNLERTLAECKKIVNEHEQKHAILEAVIASAGGPVFSVDRRYRYTSFNQQHAVAMKSLFDVDIEMGHSLLDYHTNPLDRRSAKKYIDRALRGETVLVESYAGDERLSRRYFEIVHTPIRSMDKTIVGVSIHARDTTERKRTEEQIEILARFPSENPNPVLRVSSEGVLLYANPASQPLLDQWQATVGQPLPPIWLAAIQKVGRQTSLAEMTFGERVYSFEFSHTLRMGYINLYGHDITERKLAEETLVASETRYRLLFEAAQDGILILNAQTGQIADVNPYLVNMMGFSKEFFLGKKLWEIGPFKHIAASKAALAKFEEQKYFRNENLPLETSGGRRIDVEFVSTVYHVDQQKVIQFNIRDMTARVKAETALRQVLDGLEMRVRARTKELVAANQRLRGEIAERERVEAALRESEERYRTLFETSPDAVIMTDLNHKILFANLQAVIRHGYKNPKRLIGLSMDTLIAPEDRQRIRDRYLKILETGTLRDIDFQFLRKDGTRFPAELNVSVIRDARGNPIGYLKDIRDITERKRIEESLRLANAYNRSLIEASLDPLATITRTGKIGDVNKATEVITGYTRAELIGTDFHSYFSDPPKARAGYRKVFETGTVRDFNLEIRNKNGSVTPVLYNASIYRDDTGEVNGVFAVARDITDRKQFETQLVQAEKHAVIGRMVGSITHEINNPLQTIKNCLYLIQQDVTPDNPIQEPLEMATSETLRITNLVGQLRELYRPKMDSQKDPHEILDILEEAHSLLVPHLNNARVQWQPMAGLQRCYIYCVRDQILEVFLNICMNAIEAMQSHGGTLFVNMDVSEVWAAVIIRDTGPGIPLEMMPHIFEPFMTTKARGLGLGLSITYGIIQRHGGQIQVDNQPGQGASFTVTLPLNVRLLGEEIDQNGD